MLNNTMRAGQQGLKTLAAALKRKEIKYKITQIHNTMKYNTQTIQGAPIKSSLLQSLADNSSTV